MILPEGLSATLVNLRERRSDLTLLGESTLYFADARDTSLDMDSSLVSEVLKLRLPDTLVGLPGFTVSSHQHDGPARTGPDRA